MEIAASTKGASKEYKTDDTLITSLEPTTLDFIINELSLTIGPSDSGKTTQELFRHSKKICDKMNFKSSKYENVYHNFSSNYFINLITSIFYNYVNK